MPDPDLTTRIESWLANDIDPGSRAALQGLFDRARGGDADAVTELRAAFAAPLEFGTAGLRGRLGPGPARMNRVVVSQTAAGLGAHLLSQGHSGRILIGYDARHQSHQFAVDSAEVFSAQGFEVLLTDRPVPTPVVAFGIQHLGCLAAVVVTASHNPPLDNGYKVYLGDGCQIIPPDDTLIAARIRQIETVAVGELPRSTDYHLIGDELIDAYVDRAHRLVEPLAERAVRWVYTPLHGVGKAVVDRVVEHLGLPAAYSVPEQAEPDPGFPTVSFPNPEEPGALDLALQLARETGADLVVANDPDADRCAVAIPFPEDGPGRWRVLHGDELGALLADEFGRRGVSGTYANSIVSGSMLARIAAAYGLPHEQTLTGFKWIGRVRGLAFGYEEAIGYCCDPGSVRDKDGITALVAILLLAAKLRAQGSCLADRLDELARRHGVHLNEQLSVRVDEPALIARAMSRLRAEPPAELCGEMVEVADLINGTAALPPTDAVQLRGDTVTVTVRPSGTEPKLKCYLEARVPADLSRQDLAGSRAEARGMMDRIREEMQTALGL